MWVITMGMLGGGSAEEEWWVNLWKDEVQILRREFPSVKPARDQDGVVAGEDEVPNPWETTDQKVPVAISSILWIDVVHGKRYSEIFTDTNQHP